MKIVDKVFFIAMKISFFTPHEFKNHLQHNKIFSGYYETEAGVLQIMGTPLGVHAASFVDNVQLSADVRTFVAAEITDPVTVLYAPMAHYGYAWDIAKKAVLLQSESAI